MDLRSLEFAHDLKMPIQLIYSCVQLLEMEIGANSRAESYLRMLTRSADQLQSMVRSALDGESLEREEAHLALRDVVGLARDTCRQYALCARQKGLKLCFCANVSQFRMPVDAEKLERILRNLIANALRFTPAGGRVELSATLRGDSMEFAVQDSGCGIEPNRQEKVFETGVSDGGDGYGLGIVRRYAQLLGGDVRLESAPGRGCRFSVRLPVRAAERAARA